MSDLKKDEVYLKHIINCIKNILNYSLDIDEKTFLENQLIKDAVVRNLEVIGEATKRISENLRNSSTNIEWKKMAGLRDKLIHDYIEIDYEIIWYTIKEFIPKLKVEIENILTAKEDN